MFLLTLTNFRCFESKSFTFEEGQTTLVSGVSGVGKTTFLEALSFAVTGKCKNPYPRGRRCKVTVELEAQGMKIVRTKNPETLVVKSGDDEFKDNEGQQLINRYFNEEKLWFSSSYVSQENNNVFIDMKPQEKYDFLENLCLSEDGEAYLDRTSDLIRSTESNLVKINAKIETLEETIKSFETSVTPWSKKSMIKEFGTDDLDEAEKATRKKLEQEILIEAENEKYERAKNLLPEVEWASDEILRRKEKQIARKNILDKISSIKTIPKEKIRDQIDVSKKYQEYLQKKRIYDTNSEIMREIQTLPKSYDEQKFMDYHSCLKQPNGVKCPSCSAYLVFMNNNLVAGKEIDKSAIKREYDELVKQKQGVERRALLITKLDKDVAHPPEEVSPPEFTDSQLREEIAKWNFIEKSSKEISDEDLGDEILKDVNQIRSALEQKKQCLDILKGGAPKALTGKKKRYEKILKIIGDQKIARKNREIKDKIEKLEAAKSENERRLGHLNHILTSIKTAKANRIVNGLNHLNATLGSYSTMFFDHPIDIRLVKDKKSIDFEITYGGNTFTGLKTLSGGERSRISLALTLAISDLAKSKILMLDETVSTLDADNKANIVEVLKETGKTIVIVLHDTTEGMFDEVIHLN